ncbi:MAG: arsenosugar biosynthesis radical SAM protein ArsS [Lachnospiraceae bacterium]|jgi:radical SAM/Cys-rich protein|nr:arsenosugar biosynthesis radical SAM protein ArsS [Lachnospiraceae bacterium]
MAVGTTGNVPFEERVNEQDKYTASELSVLQMNLGRVCNLSCKHCHMEAGPARSEVMKRPVMESALLLYKKYGFSTIDITGGAPEMNPDFSWFLDEACKICQHVIVRTNLVILGEKPYDLLIRTYAKNKVELVCSLPHYLSEPVDRVRGEGTFEKAIEILKKLNAVGYGINEELILDMVYNPAGAFFAPPQGVLEKEYKEKLKDEYGISFNQLFVITNNPVGRFGNFLMRTGNYESYLGRLEAAFNEKTLPNMMCRFQLSVGYDGKLYDCDFNQAANLTIKTGETIFDLLKKEYEPREIRFGQHCYACTAGQGSSCGGATD